MFISYDSISRTNARDLVIDVRTASEYNNQKLFKHNIPIINESQHNNIKKCYPLAFFIIMKSIMNNKEEIKREILEISDNGKVPIIVACSRGRLRSPLTCLFAWSIGVKCKVLWKGIKPIFKKY